MEIDSIHGEVNTNFRPLSIEEDVFQNVKYILVSMKNKAPLARDLGVENIIDKPGNLNNSGYETKIIEALEKWEPRFRVNEVIMKYDDQGRWLATVRGDIVES